MHALTEAQEEAIRHPARRLQIVACAGSGEAAEQAYVPIDRMIGLLGPVKLNAEPKGRATVKATAALAIKAFLCDVCLWPKPRRLNSIPLAFGSPLISLYLTSHFAALGLQVPIERGV